MATIFTTQETELNAPVVEASSSGSATVARRFFTPRRPKDQDFPGRVMDNLLSHADRAGLNIRESIADLGDLVNSDYKRSNQKTTTKFQVNGSQVCPAAGNYPDMPVLWSSVDAIQPKEERENQTPYRRITIAMGKQATRARDAQGHKSTNEMRQAINAVAVNAGDWVEVNHDHDVEFQYVDADGTRTYLHILLARSLEVIPAPSE